MNEPKQLENTVRAVMQMFLEEYGAKFAISPQRTSMWIRMLSGDNIDAIMTTAYHLVSTTPIFPPDLATFRKSLKYMERGQLSPVTGIEAWERVAEKLNGSKIELNDMEKRALKQAGGAYELRRSSNLAANRTRFVMAYDGLLRRAEEEMLATPDVKKFLESVKQKLPAPETRRRLESKVGQKSDPRKTAAAIEDSKRRFAEIVRSAGTQWNSNETDA